MNAENEEAKACCALIAAPVVLPFAGLAWCWWKLYGFFYGLAAVRQAAVLEASLPFSDNIWRSRAILLGWSAGDTVYIALDAREATDACIARQVELQYSSKRNYVFILVDALRIDRWGVHNVMQCVHGTESVSVYGMVPYQRVLSLENTLINVPGYYGPLGNRFRVSYY